MVLLQQVCFIKAKVLLQLYLFNAAGGVNEVGPKSTSQNIKSSICFTLM